MEFKSGWRICFFCGEIFRAWVLSLWIENSFYFVMICMFPNWVAELEQNTRGFRSFVRIHIRLWMKVVKLNPQKERDSDSCSTVLIYPYFVCEKFFNGKFIMASDCNLKEVIRIKMLKMMYLRGIRIKILELIRKRGSGSKFYKR